MRHGIDLVFDRQLLQQGIKYYHRINPDINCHMLTMGNSGSGKTYLNLLTIARFSMHYINSKIYVLDYKNLDYLAFADCARLFTFNNCYEGLEEFYNAFQKRLSGEDNTRNMLFLVIEELSSFILSLDKRKTETAKEMIGTMINLGRAMNCQLLISSQRGDANLFPNGARESLSNVFIIGNASKEMKSMFLKDFEDEIKKVHGKGSGYMLINGSKFAQIQVPQIRDINKLNTYIRRALS